MFEGWGDFYFLTGSAAASLIGLMFIVTTLTRSGDPSKTERGQRLFMTPTVFCFAGVLCLSALSLLPKVTPQEHRLLLGAVGLYGLGYASVVMVQLARLDNKATSHWSDFWCYGAAPLAAFAAYETAVAISARFSDVGCDGVAISLLALLLVAVRNAWDLVTWIAPRRPTPPEA